MSTLQCAKRTKIKFQLPPMNMFAAPFGPVNSRSHGLAKTPQKQQPKRKTHFNPPTLPHGGTFVQRMAPITPANRTPRTQGPKKYPQFSLMKCHANHAKQHLLAVVFLWKATSRIQQMFSIWKYLFSNHRRQKKSNTMFLAWSWSCRRRKKKKKKKW